MTMETIPEIVCLCGSTRFKEEYRAENARLTLEGKIVLSVGFFHHSGDSPPGVAEAVEEFEDSEEKADLDELHKRKIELADRVHVIDPGGYVGESTESEIKHARETGTPVTRYSDDDGTRVATVGHLRQLRAVFKDGRVRVSRRRRKHVFGRGTSDFASPKTVWEGDRGEAVALRDLLDMLLGGRP